MNGECDQSQPSVHRGAVMDCSPDLVARLGEFGRAAHYAEIRARMLQRHVHDFLHAAILHDHDAVSDQDRFVEVVGDEQDRLAGAAMDRQQLALKCLARLRVESTERLVHKQNFRIDGKRAGNTDTLFHSPRKLVRTPVLRVSEAHKIQVLLCGLSQLRAANAFHFQSKHHVLHGRKPGQQFGMLEHHASIVSASGDLATIDDHPSGARGVKSHCDAQRGGFAAAGWTDQRHDLAVLDREVDVLESLNVVHLAIHAQGKAFGYVEEGHLTHSRLQNSKRASQWPITFSAFSRYSGAVTALRSSGAFNLPAFTICSWIHWILSAGSGSVGSTARFWMASSYTKSGRGSSGLALMTRRVRAIVSSRCESA